MEIVFESSRDRVFARLGVRVPNGGVISLANVFLDVTSGQAKPELREVEFEGVVDTLDCAAGILLVSSSADPAGLLFSVDVAAAIVRDEEGRAITCEDLMVGDLVEVEAEIEKDGLLARTEIERKRGEGKDPWMGEDWEDGEDREDGEDGEDGDGEGGEDSEDPCGRFKVS